MAQDNHGYVYVIRSAAGARLIGGSNSGIPIKATHVVFHTPYPFVYVSFGTEPQGIAWSWIRRRGATWQASLPIGRLRIPSGLFFSEQNTRVETTSNAEKVVFNLSRITGAVRAASNGRDAVLAEASELIFRLGGLFERHPWLQEELGVSLTTETAEGE